jgi:hypothetical protein
VGSKVGEKIFPGKRVMPAPSSIQTSIVFPSHRLRGIQERKLRRIIYYKVVSFFDMSASAFEGDMHVVPGGESASSRFEFPDES